MENSSDFVHFILRSEIELSPLPFPICLGSKKVRSTLLGLGVRARCNCIWDENVHFWQAVWETFFSDHDLQTSELWLPMIFAHSPTYRKCVKLMGSHSYDVVGRGRCPKSRTKK